MCSEELEEPFWKKFPPWIRRYTMLLDVSMSSGAAWSSSSQTETMRGKTKETKPHTHMNTFPKTEA